MSFPDWLAPDGGGKSLLTVHLQPGAKRTAVLGPHGGALKIGVAAAPVDGQANVALIRFLAATLHLPQSALTLFSGARSRRKRVAIELEAATVVKRLAPPANNGDH